MYNGVSIAELVVLKLHSAENMTPCAHTALL